MTLRVSPPDAFALTPIAAKLETLSEVSACWETRLQNFWRCSAGSQMTNDKFAMRLKNLLFWIAALLAFFLDQLTKYWVVQTFSLGQTQALLPGVFHFTYVTNTGAAFSLLAGKVEWLRWLSLGVSLALIALASFGPVLHLWDQLGYGFILGGAIGNGIDRFVRGYVVDFLDFRVINFPVFNLADVFINIGIVCLLIATFQKTPTSNRR